MSVLDRLAQASGVYWGRGHGPGELVVRAAVEACDDGTVRLGYEAWSPSGGLVHVEAARLGRVDDGVSLVSASAGDHDPTMAFREGDPGVFGSTGPERVGLVVTVDDDGLRFSWWWPDEHGELREQSHARLAAVRTPPAAPGLPVSRAPGHEQATLAGAEALPWPGVVVLSGPRTALLAGRLAARLSRVAVLRTDLADAAVMGSRSEPDPGIRRDVTVATVRAYVEVGLPVLVHGRTCREQDDELVAALLAAGVRPVRLLTVGDDEPFGEVARRLVER